MKSKRVLSVILACVLLVVGMIPTYAGTTQEKINNARDARSKMRASLDATQTKINNLEAKKGESEVYLSELNAQLETLKEELIRLQAEEEAKQVELEAVQAELEEALKTEAKQYEDMKLRIQYMYEKSSSDYVTMLLSAEDFTEFLNRAEVISQISEYDRNMLKEYQDTKELVISKEAEVQAEKEAIGVLRDESAQKQVEVELVRESTNEQISIYQADIQDAESKEAALLSKISAQENEINALVAQAKEEEAAAARARAAEAQAKKDAQAAKKSSTSSKSGGTSKTASKPSSNSSSGSSSSSSSNSSSNSSGSSSSGGTYLGKFTLTAYCACSKCCGKWAGGGTASGTTPTAGRTVAMGGVPFGTKLSINGTIYTVEDRGTGYGHVDIFFSNHAEALRFGSKRAEVYQVN